MAEGSSQHELTRREFFAATGGLAAMSIIPSPTEQVMTPQLSSEHRLSYSSPAPDWNSALPIGNGSLGAMVFGRSNTERLQINHDTFWSGRPKKTNYRGGPADLGAVREALLNGDFLEGDSLARKLQSDFTEAYQPLCDLEIDLCPGEVEGYERGLDLAKASAFSTWQIEGQLVQTECFSIHPDQILVYRVKGLKSAKVRLSSPHPWEARQDGNLLVLTTAAPEISVPNYWGSDNPIVYGRGIRAAVVLEVVGGSVTSTGSKGELTIVSKGDFHLRLAACTTFKGFDQDPGQDPEQAVDAAKEIIEKARSKSLTKIRSDHEKDFARLYKRVDFKLPRVLPAEADTLTRLNRAQEVDDPSLSALIYNFGRYLVISASRPGTQAMNLQGIWNDSVCPPWSSNYTININAEMNYWPVEAANLSECHEPLLSMIEDLAVKGKETAKTLYDCEGWCAHHNSDLWRHSGPVGEGSGDPRWANWCFGGAWLCWHLWNHYQYSKDLKFLKEEALPLIKGSAEFLLDWLIEDTRESSGRDAQGRPWLVTAPSTSPEIGYLAAPGQVRAVAIGASMDLALCREIFTHFIEGSSRLNQEDDLVKKCREARDRIAPFKIGVRGQLQEFTDDLMEDEVTHRHTSQLYALHPGDQISLAETPKLAEACRRSMRLRGDEATGWAMGWRISLWARLKEPTKVQEMIKRLTRLVGGELKYSGGGIYPNLFDAHPPFQIDGNFGFTSGVMEMLAQDHLGFLEILPCLPGSWTHGEIRGMKLRGGHTLELTWSSERVQVRIKAAESIPLTVRFRDKESQVKLIKGRWTELSF